MLATVPLMLTPKNPTHAILELLENMTSVNSLLFAIRIVSTENTYLLLIRNKGCLSSVTTLFVGLAGLPEQRLTRQTNLL